MPTGVTVFYDDPDYEQSSQPLVIRHCHEADIWPIADNYSGNGTKDLIDDGLHPVIAIGGRTAADGRPLNVTGVVISYEDGLTTATGHVQVNIADGYIVRNWVSNILTYSQGAAASVETAPVVGQPVYVDDSDDLSAGVTLSMSPLSEDDLPNPMAGVLWYCQDEYADAAQGGPNSSPTFDTSLPAFPTITEQVYCVMLFNGMRDLA